MRQRITSHSLVDIKDLFTPLNSGGPSHIPTPLSFRISQCIAAVCLSLTFDNSGYVVFGNLDRVLVLPRKRGGLETCQRLNVFVASRSFLMGATS